MELIDFGFNITKKCNLDCAHCLCGEAKNESITKEVITHALNGVEKVEEIYLTGGEPFLEPNLIYLLSEELKKEKVDVDKISITTNATIFNDDVKEALLYLFDGVDNAFLTVSVDKFHKEAVYRYLKNKGVSEDMFSSVYESFVKRLRCFCIENGINFYIAD